jgi:hypothetical protein
MDNSAQEFLVRVGLRVGKLEWDAEPCTYAEFRVFASPFGDSSEPIAMFSATSADLGLIDFSAANIEAGARPTKPEGAGRSATSQVFAFPDHIIPRLHTIAERGALVWWQIEDSSGYLPALPWERILWQAGRYRVVRLDATSLVVTLPRGTIDAALCFSCSAGDAGEAWAVIDWFLSMLRCIENRARLHIFADHTIRRLLKKNAGTFAGGNIEVKIYEPSPVPGFDSDMVINSHPWLDWMQSELEPYCVDFIHFVCDGDLGTETGNIRFSQAIHSADRRWTSAVGAARSRPLPQLHRRLVGRI